MEKCPFCKSGPHPDEPMTHYACGTAIKQRKDVYRPGACYEAEIVKLTEKLESWHAVVKKLDYDGTYFRADIDWAELPRLKKLGEII